jgi:hypothetical protein
MTGDSPATRGGQWLLDRLPSDIRSQLTPEVRAAIADAAAQGGGPHPVDIRLSIPLPFRRLYLAVLAGSERRSPERIDAERRRRQLVRAANIVFVVAIAVLFYAGYQLAALLISAAML